MDRHLEIRIKPFSLRHRRLVSEGGLPQIGNEARNRIWSTLLRDDEPHYYSTPDNPTWVNTSSDLDEVDSLYVRLLGLGSNTRRTAKGNFLESVIRSGEVAAVLDVLECFCAWVGDDRMVHMQRHLNDVFRDYACQWRMSEGQAFLVDNEFIEDQILAEAGPLMALAGFEGARDEFQKARNALTDGSSRDAIFYAGVSVESTYKAALGNSTKVGIELAQAYANADLLDGLPKSTAQAIQKALMPTAVLRNQLGGHGHGAEILNVPVEYAELAVNFAAAINAFVSRQHLRRLEAREPVKKTVAAATNPSVDWDPDEIPF